MKKLLKIIGILIGSLIGLLILAAAYFSISDTNTYSVEAPEFVASMDSASIAEGRRFGKIVCVQCHLGKEGKLDGALLEDENSPFGVVWAPNITQHKEYGIGSYTDGELVWLLRTGIKKDGKYLPPWMPKYPHLSDRDMNNIIAWLKSDSEEVQASATVRPKPKYSLLTKVLLKLAFKPLPYDGDEINAPDRDDKIAYGKYLLAAKIDCYGCHSPDFKKQNMMEPENTPGYLTGGNPFKDEDGNEFYSSNLTPDPETGIGNWNKEQFFELMKFGKKPDGTMIRYPMVPFPLITDDELSAIWSYLRSLTPIKNDTKS